MGDDLTRAVPEQAEASGRNEWLDRLALELREQPMSQGEVGQVLKLAREVAHGVERKLAPLAAFLAGVHVGRRSGESGPRPEDALAQAAETAARLMQERSEEPTSSPTD